MAITWKERAARARPRQAVGTHLFVAYLCAGAAASVLLLLLAGFVADGYLVDWGSVATVVLLCSAAGWGIVGVAHGAAAHRAARWARDGVSPPTPGGGPPPRRTGQRHHRARPAHR